jgi:hypothetical protein
VAILYRALQLDEGQEAVDAAMIDLERAEICRQSPRALRPRGSSPKKATVMQVPGEHWRMGSACGRTVHT